MANELLSNPRARAVIQEFWNSDEAGWDVTERMKMRKTALAAIHDCGLVGKVAAIERSSDDGTKHLYLINREKVPNGSDTDTSEQAA